MKIGILTLPLEYNYGGILQAYALQKTLKELGHEVLTIDWHNPREYNNIIHNILGWTHRIYLRFIKKKNISICWNPFPSDDHYKALTRYTRNFVENKIDLTRQTLPSYLQRIDQEYSFDAYVVGSDQVWVNSYSKRSFLDFVKRSNVIKVAYAASSNNDSWLSHPESIKIIKELSASFSHLSTRETILAEKATNELNRKVEVVLDPTFLLDAEDYLQINDSAKPSLQDNLNESTDYLFEYILDQNEFKNGILNFISEYSDLPVENSMPAKQYIKHRKMNLSDYIFPPVENWIKKISKANLVVTDSFHGTVFAIIFNIPFVSIVNNARGKERFRSLLSTFGLESRLITDNTDNQTIKALLNKPVDFDRVNQIIIEQRKNSLSFLLRALK